MDKCSNLWINSGNFFFVKAGDSPEDPKETASGLLDESVREILRCAQDDKLAVILSAAKDLVQAYG